MHPLQRRQLPRNIHNLHLQTADDDNAIEIHVGECKPAYTPFFDAHNQLVGVFYSWQNKFTFTRQRLPDETWPRERVFIDREKVVRFWRYKTETIPNDIEVQNTRITTLIDPSRDARLLWDRPTWTANPAYSNVDVWVKATQARILALKNGTAKTIFSPSCHMDMLGVIIAVLSCVDKNADSPIYLHEFSEIIGQEADAYLRSGFNYAWNFNVLFKTDIRDFPYLDYLTEPMAVKLPVPDLLSPLLKSKHKVPLWQGYTYIGLRHFQRVVRLMFMTQWKDYALKVLPLCHGLDQTYPSSLAFAEFSRQVQLQPQVAINSSQLLSTSAAVLFPVLSPLAPPCFVKLFAARPLKHYARWQLGEIAVDMGWSHNNLMAHYVDTPANRREVAANFHAYQKKTPIRHRCKIFKHAKLCPYDANTFHECAGLEPTDIEDLSPALFFQRRMASL